MFFSAYTLGCKLNQLETEAIVDAFNREGFSFIPGSTPSAEPSSAQLSIIIINTCTVTSMAEQKARRLIRKLLRENPAACIIITGCYAQMEQETLSALDEQRVFVVPGEKKDSLLDLPRFIRERISNEELGIMSIPELVAYWLEAKGKITGDDGSFRFKPEFFSSHSRAFLKIQDGCDNRCAYCRVSLARGKSRSLKAGDALLELKALEKRGFAEVVLTGVNISLYRDSTMGLAGLLAFLLEGTEKVRIRLSSIEPEALAGNDGGGELIQVLANPRIRPHFHLSLQSASAEILKKMGRSYSPEDVDRALAMLRFIRQDPFIACDIITGFPGETEEDFEKTYSFCQKAGFAWIHAFPFSRRPGTAAYDFPERVSEKASARRVELLTELAKKGRREYLSKWEGKEVEAVVEAGKKLPKGFVPGVSENYLKLLIACGDNSMPSPGFLIRCRIGMPIMKRDNNQFDAIAEENVQRKPITS